jgi:branched-chain amino acid transport system ATP-binding protein/branched-chain amino acid transport system permease protein
MTPFATRLPHIVAAARFRGAWWGAALIVYVACTYFAAHGSIYSQGLVLVAASFAMLALSLDMVAGMLGMYSLGHAGLFAIGAYGATVLQASYGYNVFAALPLVMVAAAVVGLVIGALSIRVSGLYFAIATLIFTIVVNVLLSHLTITGGYQGLPGPSFPNFPSSLAGLGASVVWAVSAALLVTVAIIWSMRASAFYPVLLTVRDSEPLAATAGVRTAMTRILIFGLSSALAGLAGWAFAFEGFITPDQFNSTASINVFVMVILGGINTRLGPIIGAAFISLFPVIVSINPLAQEILFGAIFIAVIVFLPEGFVGLLARIGRGIRSRWLSPGRTAVPDDAASGASLTRPASPPVRAAGNSNDTALEARNVSFSYGGGMMALEGVDLKVPSGTIHGLIGPNGSGKSTMVNILSGLLRPQSGTITIYGQHVEHMAVWRRVNLGVMRTFQTAVMVKELTTSQNVSVGTYSRYRRIGLRSLAYPVIPSARRDSKLIAASSREALRSVGLTSSWASSRVADIPHGVEQLTQLASACAGQPTLLILDEPLAGLSSEETDHVAEILRSLRERGLTTIVIEHQTRFIFDICDSVTVLAAGQLVRSGSAAEVRNDPRVREVYLGQ